MKTYTIEISLDHAEAENFCIWLNEQGHYASIGSTTGNFVDGEWTSTNEIANEIINDLWDEYCRDN